MFFIVTSIVYLCEKASRHHYVGLFYPSCSPKSLSQLRSWSYANGNYSLYTLVYVSRPLYLFERHRCFGWIIRLGDYPGPKLQIPYLQVAAAGRIPTFNFHLSIIVWYRPTFIPLALHLGLGPQCYGPTCRNNLIFCLSNSPPLQVLDRRRNTT